MKISTSALAKKIGSTSKDLFQTLQSEWYVIRNSESEWELTQKWKKSNWEYKHSPKYGRYIVWPENFRLNNKISSTKEDNISLSITHLAEWFEISSRKMNQILSELWWIEKSLKWWKVTSFWQKVWWKQLQHYMSWTSYTHWPKDITSNKSLIKAVDDFNPNSKKHQSVDSFKGNWIDTDEFRAKFPAQYRAKDWHQVRSRWELLIDNELYWYKLVHAYERKIPIEEDIYSDFYIPAQNWGEAVYIEYWGIEDQEKYEDRKKIKKDIYKKYDLNLIELENKHIDNLDDHLPRLLLKYWINVE